MRQQKNITVSSETGLYERNLKTMEVEEIFLSIFSLHGRECKREKNIAGNNSLHKWYQGKKFGF